MSAAKLARQLKPSAGLRLRQGVVTAVNADRTVNLTIGASSVVVSNVKCLTGAVPRNGSAVMLLTDGRDLFVLGSVADNAALGFTPLIQYGSTTITVTAAAEVTSTVTFPWAFPGTPTVICSTNKDTKVFVATANVISSTGFTARVNTLDGTNTTAAPVFRWVALYDGS